MSDVRLDDVLGWWGDWGSCGSLSGRDTQWWWKTLGYIDQMTSQKFSPRSLILIQANLSHSDSTSPLQRPFLFVWITTIYFSTLLYWYSLSSIRITDYSYPHSCTQTNPSVFKSLSYSHCHNISIFQTSSHISDNLHFSTFVSCLHSTYIPTQCQAQWMFLPPLSVHGTTYWTIWYGRHTQ